VTYASNMVWQVKDNACPAGNTCNVDPAVVNPDLYNFNATPRPDSPLINKAITTAGTLAKDARSLPRPTMGGYDVGAVQYQGVCDDRIFGHAFATSKALSCP